MPDHGRGKGGKGLGKGGAKRHRKVGKGFSKNPIFCIMYNVHLVAGVEGQHPGDHKACDKASCEKGRRQKNIRAHL